MMTRRAWLQAALPAMAGFAVSRRFAMASTEGSSGFATQCRELEKASGGRLGAGVPKNWTVGDKTGSGERGTANDVGILWPPGHPPLLAAVYLTGATVDPAAREATIAGVGRLIPLLM